MAEPRSRFRAAPFMFLKELAANTRPWFDADAADYRKRAVEALRGPGGSPR
jgi:hypothetical protein